MLPYQNYSMNNMPQYQQQYQVNPYMERMQQLQAYQQQMFPQQIQNQNAGLASRMVDNFDLITANDVPMNGGALFVKTDGTEIQYRQWTAQGTIDTTRFTPILDAKTVETGNLSTEPQKEEFDRFYEAVQCVSNKIDKMEQRLDEALKQRKKKVEVISDDEY